MKGVKIVTCYFIISKTANFTLLLLTNGLQQGLAVSGRMESPISPPQKTSGQVFSLSRACGLLGPGCQKVTTRMSITLRSGDQNRCPKGTLLPVKSSKVWHSHRAEALPASGPPEGILTSLYSSLTPSLCSGLCNPPARFGNDIIVPNIYSVCWDFTADDKRAQHFALKYTTENGVVFHISKTSAMN